MRCGAVIPAAGLATRLGGTDKTTLTLAGRPVLAWVLHTLLETRRLSEIAIATSARNTEAVRALVDATAKEVPLRVVAGGETRRDSVEAGVQALSTDCDLVLIHDAARPLVSPDLIETLVDAAEATGAAIPGVRCSDTIKAVSGGVVEQTLDRDRLIAVQTPQVFRRAWLEDAYVKCTREVQATDESSLLEIVGYPVQVVDGEPENIKITTPTDLVIAEALLAARRVRR